MCGTCMYVWRMSATIEIHYVPDSLHRRLKSRAALSGMSLSGYLLGRLRALADRPTMEERRKRLEHLPPFTPSISPADAIRAAPDRL